MQDLLEDLKAYFHSTPQSKIDFDWAKYAKYDEVGPKVSELLTHFETHFPYEDDTHFERQIQNELDNIKKPESFGLFLYIFAP